MVQTGAEAAVAGDPAGLGMILHIVCVVVGYNDIGSGVTNHIGHGVHDIGIVAVHQHIAYIQIEGFLCTDDGRRCFKFLCTNFCQFLRLNDSEIWGRVSTKISRQTADKK